MQTGRILKAGLAVGVVANVWDFAFNTWLAPMMGMAQPAMMKDMADMPIPMLVVADFVAGLVLVWFLDKVRGAFGPGAKGGATFGLYVGIVAAFPTWIVMHLLMKDWPYSMSWGWTITSIVWFVIAGTVAAVVYDKG